MTVVNLKRSMMKHDVVNQKWTMKDEGILMIGYERDSKYEADHHAKKSSSTAWLMTILQTKYTTVCIVATCSRRGQDPSLLLQRNSLLHTWNELLHRTTNERTYYAPPPGKSPLGTTTKCYYYGQLFSRYKARSDTTHNMIAVFNSTVGGTNFDAL